MGCALHISEKALSDVNRGVDIPIPWFVMCTCAVFTTDIQIKSANRTHFCTSARQLARRRRSAPSEQWQRASTRTVPQTCTLSECRYRWEHRWETGRWSAMQLRGHRFLGARGQDDNGHWGVILSFFCPTKLAQWSQGITAKAHKAPAISQLPNTNSRWPSPAFKLISGVWNPVTYRSFSFPFPFPSRNKNSSTIAANSMCLAAPATCYLGFLGFRFRFLTAGPCRGAAQWHRCLQKATPDSGAETRW